MMKILKQDSSYRDPYTRRLIWIGGLLLILPLCVALAGAVIFGYPVVYLVLPRIYQPIDAAEDYETLILVSDFDGTNGSQNSNDLDQALRDYQRLFYRFDYRTGRINHSPQSEVRAIALANEYNARLIIWGEYGTQGGTLYITTPEPINPAEPQTLSIEIPNPPNFDQNDGLTNLIISIAGLHQFDVNYGNNINVGELSSLSDPESLGIPSWVVALYEAQALHLNWTSPNSTQPASIEILSMIDTLDELAQEEDTPYLVLMKAQLLLDIGSYQDAIDVLDVSEGMDGYSAGRLLFEADAYIGLGEIEKAYDAVAEGLLLDPTNRIALDRRSEIALLVGDTDIAIQDLLALIEAYPTESQWYTRLADIYTQEGDYEAALDIIHDAIDNVTDIYYGSTVLLERRALIYTQLGEYDLAIADYEQLQFDAPYNTNYQAGHGGVYWELGDQEQARIIWERSFPNTPGAYDYNNLAWSLSQLEYYEPALIYSDQALALAPNDPNSLHTHGFIQLGLGNYEEALSDFDLALANGLGYPPIYRDIADALRELGRFETAVQYYQTYLDREPFAEDRYRIQLIIAELTP